MKARLRISIDDAPSRDIVVNSESVTIGRDPACDYTFTDDEAIGVSWLHARLDSTNDVMLVCDCGSTNGTFVNGVRIASSHELAPGDIVQLGRDGPRIFVVEAENAVESGQATVRAEPAAHSPESSMEIVLPRLATVAAALAVIVIAALAIRVVSTDSSVVDETASVPPESSRLPSVGTKPTSVAKPTASTTFRRANPHDWANADVVLSDPECGAVALSMIRTNTSRRINVVSSIRSGPEMEEMLETAWDSNVPILISVPGVTARIIENVHPGEYVPDYLHDQLLALFPPVTFDDVGELVEVTTPRGSQQIGYRINETESGFDFRPLNRVEAIHVDTQSGVSVAVAPLARQELQFRVSPLDLLLDRVVRTLWNQDDRNEFAAIAVTCDDTVHQREREALESLLYQSPLQFELRPDLKDFQTAARKSWNRVTYAVATERGLLETTHLLTATVPKESESSKHEPLFRLIDLRTGNTLWQHRAEYLADPREAIDVASMADMPYLLHTGELSMVNFAHTGAIPRQLPGVSVGPFAGNNFRVAYLEDRTTAALKLRSLFDDSEQVDVPSRSVASIQPIDPDELLNANSKYDPWFASWRVARHLLPPAGRVTKVSLPLVEIDLGRKYGPEVGQEFALQRLPSADTDDVSLSYLPTRLRVREVRTNATVAEFIDPDNVMAEPKVGDIAVLVPQALVQSGGPGTHHVRKPCVALLQIRTTSQGQQLAPLHGFQKANDVSADQRAFFAMRFASELEGVLIQQECDVADHIQFWRQMRGSSEKSAVNLQSVVRDLAQKMQLTHVVLADLATAPASGGRDYVTFTVTELISIDGNVSGRQVAKVEIELRR